MKIAVVDDSEKDLSMEVDYFANYITNYHCELAHDLKVSAFSNVADFLKSFETSKFDLIALDIIMHELNGIQLAKIISSKDRNCNIIFITSSEVFLIDGYSVSAVGCFLKSISENEET